MFQFGRSYSDSSSFLTGSSKLAPSVGHTDGDLFDWITNGIPGSAMPAWGTQLSDNQRWDVINYIRTFGTSPLITPSPTP